MNYRTFLALPDMHLTQGMRPFLKSPKENADEQNSVFRIPKSLEYPKRTNRDGKEKARLRVLVRTRAVFQAEGWQASESETTNSSTTQLRHTVE